MSVKFEVAEWKFEITLKELICRPANESKSHKVKRKLAAGHKETTNNDTQKREKSYELDYASRRNIG